MPAYPSTNPTRKTAKWQLILSLSLLATAVPLFGCSTTARPQAATPLPEDYLPTAIYLTVQAGSTESSERTAEAHETPGTPSPRDQEATEGTESRPSVGFDPSLQTPTSRAFRTRTPAPPAATPTQTRTPTRTLTPTATRIPIAGIQIFRPGEMSRVISPIRVRAYLRPGYRGRIWLELYGEDGRLLYREIKQYAQTEGARINMIAEIEFEIAAVAEVGRLVALVKDEHDRITELNSVDLILLSVGEDDISPSEALDEAIIIQQPGGRNLIQGGSLVVEGLVRQVEPRQLMAQIQTPDGHIAGFRIANVFPVEGQQYARFRVEVPYDVEELTSALLQVYEDGGAISEISHLSSIEVILSP